MATIQVAINGFCRVGRSVFKIANSRSDMNIVAIRTNKTAEECAYLLTRDSLYGEYNLNVEADRDSIRIGEQIIKVVPRSLSAGAAWRGKTIDVLIDAHHHTNPAELRRHLTAGVKRIVTLSRCKDFPTIVMGVNDEAVDSTTGVVCCGDAVTNCVAPIVGALKEKIAIDAVAISSVSGDINFDSARHHRTEDSSLVVDEAPSLPVLRSVLKDVKFEGTQVFSKSSRSVGMAIISAVVDSTITAPEIIDLLRQAMSDPLRSGIMMISNQKLVAEDLLGNSFSAVIDENLTTAASGKLLQIVAWYDGEWATANRLIELTADTGRFARNRR